MCECGWVGEGEWKQRKEEGGSVRMRKVEIPSQYTKEIFYYPSIHPSVNRQDAAANERSKGSWTTVYGVGYEMKSPAMHAS